MMLVQYTHTPPPQTLDINMWHIMLTSNTTFDFDFCINQSNVVSSEQYVETTKIVISSSRIKGEIQKSIEIEVTYYRCSIRKEDHIRPIYLTLRGSSNLELELRFITCNTIVKGGGNLVPQINTSFQLW
jgi:hypothetical protein